MFQVLVEVDGASWKDRRWIKLHQECQYFAVERSVVWAPVSDVIGDDSIRAPTDDALYVPALVRKSETAATSSCIAQLDKYVSFLAELRRVGRQIER